MSVACVGNLCFIARNMDKYIHLDILKQNASTRKVKLSHNYIHLDILKQNASINKAKLSLGTEFTFQQENDFKYPPRFVKRSSSIMLNNNFIAFPSFQI